MPSSRKPGCPLQSVRNRHTFAVLNFRSKPQLPCHAPTQCYLMQRASNTKGRPKPLNRRPATTTEVLGNQSAQPKIPSKWKKHYDRLAELHEQLLRNKNDLAEDARQETP